MASRSTILSRLGSTPPPITIIDLDSECSEIQQTIKNDDSDDAVPDVQIVSVQLPGIPGFDNTEIYKNEHLYDWLKTVDTTIPSDEEHLLLDNDNVVLTSNIDVGQCEHDDSWKETKIDEIKIETDKEPAAKADNAIAENATISHMPLKTTPPPKSSGLRLRSKSMFYVTSQEFGEQTKLVVRRTSEQNAKINPHLLRKRPFSSDATTRKPKYKRSNVIHATKQDEIATEKCPNIFEKSPKSKLQASKPQQPSKNRKIKPAISRLHTPFKKRGYNLKDMSPLPTSSAMYSDENCPPNKQSHTLDQLEVHIKSECSINEQYEECNAIKNCRNDEQFQQSMASQTDEPNQQSIITQAVETQTIISNVNNDNHHVETQTTTTQKHDASCQTSTQPQTQTVAEHQGMHNETQQTDNRPLFVAPQFIPNDDSTSDVRKHLKYKKHFDGPLLREFVREYSLYCCWKQTRLAQILKPDDHRLAAILSVQIITAERLHALYKLSLVDMLPFDKKAFLLELHLLCMQECAQIGTRAYPMSLLFDIHKTAVTAAANDAVEQRTNTNAAPSTGQQPEIDGTFSSTPTPISHFTKRIKPDDTPSRNTIETVQSSSNAKQNDVVASPESIVSENSNKTVRSSPQPSSSSPAALQLPNANNARIEPTTSRSKSQNIGTTAATPPNNHRPNETGQLACRPISSLTDNISPIPDVIQQEQTIMCDPYHPYNQPPSPNHQQAWQSQQQSLLNLANSQLQQQKTLFLQQHQQQQWIQSQPQNLPLQNTYTMQSNFQGDQPMLHMQMNQQQQQIHHQSQMPLMQQQQNPPKQPQPKPLTKQKQKQLKQSQQKILKQQQQLLAEQQHLLTEQQQKQLNHQKQLNQQQHQMQIMNEFMLKQPVLASQILAQISVPNNNPQSLRTNHHSPQSQSDPNMLLPHNRSFSIPSGTQPRATFQSTYRQTIMPNYETTRAENTQQHNHQMQMYPPSQMPQYLIPNNPHHQTSTDFVQNSRLPDQDFENNDMSYNNPSSLGLATAPRRQPLLPTTLQSPQRLAQAVTAPLRQPLLPTNSQSSQRLATTPLRQPLIPLTSQSSQGLDNSPRRQPMLPSTSQSSRSLVKSGNQANLQQTSLQRSQTSTSASAFDRRLPIELKLAQLSNEDRTRAATTALPSIARMSPPVFTSNTLPAVRQKTVVASVVSNDSVRSVTSPSFDRMEIDFNSSEKQNERSRDMPAL